jgi:hypothetical protein
MLPARLLFSLEIGRLAMSNGNDKDKGTTQTDNLRTALGFVLAVVGLLVVAFVYWQAEHNFETAADVAAVVGATTGVIGTIVAAFFGIQAASSSADKASNTAQKALDNEHYIARKALAIAFITDRNSAEAKALIAELTAGVRPAS